MIEAKDSGNIEKSIYFVFSFVNTSADIWLW